MKYIVLILLIIAASAIGYYAGQNFYKEKISPTKETEKPLISPLIEEKTYNTFSENNQPSIVIPHLQREEKNKKSISENDNNNSLIPNTTITTIKTTTKKEESISSEHNEKEIEENTSNTNHQETKKESNSESVIPETKQENNEKNLNIDGLYYIQLGSFSSIDNAKAMKTQLESIGLEPKVEQIIIEEKSIYRVIIGPYRTEEEAIEESNKLKKMGIDNVVKNY
ncbi:MAG: SPOR domain-containing protein [bacterium]|nr:SPOR domain-containing protein [bacterium]